METNGTMCDPFHQYEEKIRRETQRDNNLESDGVK